MFNILTFNKSHVNDVAKLEKICFVDPYSHRILEAAVESERDISFVAVTDGTVIGYIELGDFVDTLCINRIEIAPDYRKKGVASALLKKASETACEHSIEELSLEVRESNTAARSLYEKIGFTLVGKRPNYYKDPREDAAIYIKKLNGAY